MINLAYPTAPAEVIEQLSVSSFVDGLRDPENSQLARHKTISEALAHALEIEALKKASRVAITRIEINIRRRRKLVTICLIHYWSFSNSSRTDETLEAYREWRKKTDSLLDVWS
ncbi:hypothetical protein NQ315_005041 [Exocentrus adspersus]|uniref:Uncharacterized protein n=1 Tax=Exocentrus adspersus TaxID=1586481 RepID=A0AAV8VRH7_9CUCU|nr:hypothetical protein NQ315_005041 [Exocentrus adspersus]